MLLLLNTNDDNSFMTTQTALVTFNDRRLKHSSWMLILKMSIIYDFQASEKLSTKQWKIPTELSGIIKLLKMLSYIS